MLWIGLGIGFLLGAATILGCALRQANIAINELIVKRLW